MLGLSSQGPYQSVCRQIVEGLVPAMPPHQFLESERANKTKRPILATTKFKDFITSNVVKKTPNF